MSCILVAWNPLIWNVIARIEYKTHLVSYIFRGPKKGCTALGLLEIYLSYLRTQIFYDTIDSYSSCELGNKKNYIIAFGYLLSAVGTALVIGSYYRLGFYGAFMGDHFGILLDHKITEFPYNIVDDPMYVGTPLIYFGWAIERASIFGLLLAVCITFSYIGAAHFEKPFTTMIYAEAMAKKAESKKKQS